MLKVDYHKDFLKFLCKMRDLIFKDKIKKQIIKIIENPKIGKPMRYSRKGTRELYVKPYRIAYAYLQSEEKIIFLEIYHKNRQ
jgi:mRNA-degrading endonuclease RelE of RelBE toxin-antitoxin system